MTYLPTGLICACLFGVAPAGRDLDQEGVAPGLDLDPAEEVLTLLEPGEAPDSGALREFEEETGILLEELKFYRMFRRDPDFPASITDTYHIYFGDPDLDEAEIEVNEGQAFRYFAPNELGALEMPPHAREILVGFFESAHYRRLFH